ncbi:MAG: hypothetical protein AAF720_04160 [Pseudomonadota bacterium]
MTDNSQDELLRPMTPEEEIVPTHREWMDKQIRQTLDKKSSGDASYTPLDEVRRNFGF